MGRILGDENLSFDLKEVCHFLESGEMLPITSVHPINLKNYKADKDTTFFFFKYNLKAGQSHDQGRDSLLKTEHFVKNR